MKKVKEIVSGLMGQRPPHLQVAAICTRKREGVAEVLLVTSRGTGRWIVPKGWPMKGRSLASAAEQEAWEEAGVKGKIGSKPIGSYVYAKLRSDSFGEDVEVLAFLLKVDRVEKRFPEEGQRERAWFDAGIAAGLVDEPGLQEILRAL
ncbi:NUDIX hydrolase [Pseudothioclava arenosa]|nr:NUDIX hydrolase [Pseudothioclava arenosa]